MIQAMTGSAPKTDANGRFNLPKVGNGKGALMVMPNEGFNPLTTKPYEITNGQHLDLGRSRSCRRAKAMPARSG